VKVLVISPSFPAKRLRHPRRCLHFLRPLSRAALRGQQDVHMKFLWRRRPFGIGTNAHDGKR